MWYEENKSELLEEQPDISDEDRTQKAAETFRQLPKDERQVHTCKVYAVCLDLKYGFVTYNGSITFDLKEKVVLFFLLFTYLA